MEVFRIQTRNLVLYWNVCAIFQVILIMPILRLKRILVELWYLDFTHFLPFPTSKQDGNWDMSLKMLLKWNNGWSQKHTQNKLTRACVNILFQIPQKPYTHLITLYLFLVSDFRGILIILLQFLLSWFCGLIKKILVLIMLYLI